MKRLDGKLKRFPNQIEMNLFDESCEEGNRRT